MSQNGSAARRAPLTKEQQALVEDALHFMEVIAARLGQPWANLLPRDEIQAVAAEALAEAAQTYDPARSVPFTTYAHHRIQGAILDFARSELQFQGPYIALGMHRAASDYLAEQPDVPQDDAGNTMRDWRKRSANLAGGAVAAAFASMVADVLNTQDGTDEALARKRAFEGAEAALQDVRRQLIERERVVLDLHYGQEIALIEVATQMGIAYATAKRIHAALLINMQSMLRERGYSTLADTGIAG